jgi:hypothetical protein
MVLRIISGCGSIGPTTVNRDIFPRQPGANARTTWRRWPKCYGFIGS